MMDLTRVGEYAGRIYGLEAAREIMNRLEGSLPERLGALPHLTAPPLSEREAILITYPDQIQVAGVSALESLLGFAREYLTGGVTGIHLLLFYPSSSDDGFSVIDYRAVAPEFGEWDDVRQIGREFHLMFDAVLNHAFNTIEPLG